MTIRRFATNVTENKTIAQHQGNAVHGELIINLDSDPPQMLIGDIRGNLDVVGGAGIALGTPTLAQVAAQGGTTNANIALSGANVSLGSVANLHVAGGANAMFLRTNGSGSLTWDDPGRNYRTYTNVSAEVNWDVVPETSQVNIDLAQNTLFFVDGLIFPTTLFFENLNVALPQTANVTRTLDVHIVVRPPDPEGYFSTIEAPADISTSTAFLSGTPTRGGTGYMDSYKIKIFGIGLSGYYLFIDTKLGVSHGW